MNAIDVRPLLVEPPEAPTIAGLRFRRWAGPDDLPAMNEVANAALRANGDAEQHDLERMRIDYANLTNCDPTRDVLLAEVGTELAAYGRVWWEDRNDGRRGYISFGFVHPRWRRRGVGWAMHRWLEARNLDIGAEHATDRRRVLMSFGHDVDQGNTALLMRAGYTIERRFAHMVRTTLDDVDVPPLPAGLEVRPGALGHARAVFEADADAFAEQWGATDASDAAWNRFRDRPDLDPSLWVLGWDGDQIAGGVLLEIQADDEPDLRRGWLARVFVRRPWRRRGLAAALIGRSLVVLRARGMEGAQLGVDVENIDRALDLYQRAGFVVDASDSAWSKPWPGPVSA